MTQIPIDPATGLQAGDPVHIGKALVVKGWLVTLPDGHETRLGPDETRARLYAVQQRAVRVEALFVMRVDAAPPRQIDAGGAIGPGAMPG